MKPRVVRAIVPLVVIPLLGGLGAWFFSGDAVLGITILLALLVGGGIAYLQRSRH